MRSGGLLIILAGCGFQAANAPGDGALIDTPPTGRVVEFAMGGQTVMEGNATLTAEVTLTPVSTQPVTIPFTIAGTAGSGDASVTTTSPITIPAGATRALIEIEISEDTMTESNETLVITLGAPTGADLGVEATHSIQITDDDTQVPCIGAGIYSVCLGTAPTNNVILDLPFDTAANSSQCMAAPAGWTSQGQPDACFVIGAMITVNATVSVSGPRPLVLVGYSSIVVNGILDVASHRQPMKIGPASPGSQCGSIAGPGGTSSGGGGGPGGTFRSRGGDGGDGKGAGGGTSATVLALPTLLRGGCNGTAGGNGDVPAGAIGRGGGVVYLVSSSSISIAGGGSINASGSAGSGGGDSSGGSGGGSGGMIKLNAPSISVNGTILANGGGAASGADDNIDGEPGQEPNPAMANVPAIGGVTPPHSGGTGYAGLAPATKGGNGNPASDNAGGGGGGGGGGLIELSVSVMGTNISAGQIRITP